MSQKIKLFSISLIIAILLFGMAPKTDASEISLLMDSLEIKLDWLTYKISLEQWELYTTGDSDSLRFYEDLYTFVVTDPLTAKALADGQANVSGSVNKRRWDLINSEFYLGPIDNDTELNQLKDSLSRFDINNRIEYNGETRTSNWLYKRSRSNSNRAEREKAFRAYCATGDAMADGLERLFRLRNRKAEKAGFNSYLAYVFRDKKIDLNEYKALLGKLDSLSRQPYRTIIERLKSKLSVNKIDSWDLGYAYQDINSQVDQYFPVDSQLKYIHRSLKGMGFDLDELPIYFDLDSREGKSQFAYAFTIRSPHDMRVLANLSPGIYSTRVLMHEIGHTIHSAFISQDQPIFRSSPSGSWSEGMAQFFAGLMDNNLWLEKYAHLPYALATSYLKSKKEEDIIYLRSTLVRLNFELQAYANPNRDLNKLYWDLVETYMELPRHEDIKPWAGVIHFTTHPVYLDNYLYGDMIAAQTLSYLNKNNGSVVDNPDTKPFLIQNYFRFGARYEWQELIERGTSEEINPQIFIDHLGL